jgi:WhiB family redox-sensing transcriptional regulator
MTAELATDLGPWFCRSTFCDNQLRRPRGHTDGFCSACMQRWYRSGKEGGAPPPPVPPGERRRPPGPGPAARARRRQFAALKAQGMTTVEAAAAMGVSLSAARKWDAEARCKPREGELLAVEDLPVPARPLLHAEDWRDRAACRGMSWDLFYSPEGERGPEREAREARAKALCVVCPVRGECLEAAMGRTDWYGVQGGLNGDERQAEHKRRLKRESNRRKAAAKGAAA